MARRMITYPTGRLLGVVDDPATVVPAREELVAAGFAADAIEVLVGDEGRDRLGRLGRPPNGLSRLIRVFQFLLMDQTPDFIVYEAALLEGRAVIAVRVENRARMLQAAAVLERRDGHFLNAFGRLATEEISMWRGPEPSIPDALRR
jgi:hypothetical protein